MTSTNSRFEPRRLPVQWFDHSWVIDVGHSPNAQLIVRCHRAGPPPVSWFRRRSGLSGRKRGGSPPPAGFTVLEMLIVVTIIGLLSALAIPHLSGMTKANSMTAATQQLGSVVSLARQMAISRRSTVYLVFDSPSAFPQPAPLKASATYANLELHQYTAYALVSPRSVGDQPGRPNPQYLTEWKNLPDGVFFPTYMFTGFTFPVPIPTVNTLGAQTHTNYAVPYSYVSLPFPTASSPPVLLPCIGFTSQGQLITLNGGAAASGGDEYIPLARGAVRYLPGNVVSAIENPTGNSTNDANLIHIDAYTARAKLEHNTF